MNKYRLRVWHIEPLTMAGHALDRETLLLDASSDDHDFITGLYYHYKAQKIYRVSVDITSMVETNLLFHKGPY
jgi:hypothetical protein